jgi:hypothetical protein
MSSTTGGLTTSVLAALNTAFQTAVETALTAVLSSTGQIKQYIAMDLNPNKVPSQTLVRGVAGAVVSAPLPSEMCATIRKNSALKGQHGRGRVSIPLIPGTFVSPGTNPDQIVAGSLTTYGTLASALSGTLSASGLTFTPVITTRPVLPAVIPGNAQPIISHTTDATMGTARRRKPGRGR